MLKIRAINCGKKCNRCPHGYYVYAQWKEQGKVKEKYLGKLGSAEVAANVQDMAKQHPRISNEFENYQGADFNA
jgi:hypothetical protein